MLPDLYVPDLFVNVIVSGEKVWHLALFQPNFNIEENRPYTLRFRIRGESTNQILVEVTRKREPRTSIAPGARQNIAVVDDWQSHTIHFESVQALSMDEVGVRILFEFGDADPGMIWLDDVVFEVGVAE